MRALFLISFLLLLSVSAQAAPAKAPAANKEPLKIKSDTLSADNEKKTAVFEGKVVARQGDMTLYADRLVISYTGTGYELSKVEAFGNVRVFQENRQATGAQGVYDPKAATITLTGSPKVVQGEDVVTGKVIVYYVNEKRSVVSGGPAQRVEAVIHPGGADGSKK